ncbi:MAG: hypothetical protein NTX88_09890 [Candidatus Atribacteria bacterium]|nr:hypothetical protein [Candidatus Atribacteria bacterium]
MHKENPDPASRDYNSFKENGWLESDYYYPVKVNFCTRWLGKTIDRLGRKLAVKRNRQLKRESASKKNKPSSRRKIHLYWL